MLDLPLESPIELKQLSVRCFDAVAGAQRLKRGQYAGFPIDEGAVAVEGDRVEPLKVQSMALAAHFHLISRMRSITG